MTLQTGQKVITIYILPNISRRKRNQTKKFGQLLEYNMIIIFLEKSYVRCGGEASPRPIYKKSKLMISLDQQSEMLYSLFLLYIQVEVYQITKSMALAFTSYKTFFKKKRSPELVSLPQFLHDIFMLSSL